VLDLDRQAPDASSPDAAGVYQSFYNKLRSEHDAISNGYAEARRLLAERHFAKALQICQDFLTRYPGHALFQAIKFDINEQQRQQLSAFIADVDRRLDAEADLDAKVSLVREALVEYPSEDHFKRLARLHEDKRDLVNSIVERARVHESNGQIAEALGDYDTLHTIYAAYPGWSFEKERLQKRLHQQARDAAHATWVRQIDAQLSAGDYARAAELLDNAETEFPDDAELSELRKLASQGSERTSRADQLIAEGQELCARGQFDQGVDLLNIALQLDDRTSVRMTLRDLFVARAQEGMATDWRVTEAFADRALELDPNHALARSLRAQALDKKREADVEQCASQSRRLQAAGEFEAAMAEVERGLSQYPGDTRLGLIADAVRKELGRPAPPPVEPASASAASARRAPSSAPRSASGPPPPPSAPMSAPQPEAIERTRLVPERRAGQGTPLPTVDEPPAVETEPIALPVKPRATSSPAPARTTQAPSRRFLWPLVAAAAMFAIIVVVLVQRYRSAPAPAQPIAEVSATAQTPATAATQPETPTPTVEVPTPTPTDTAPAGAATLDLRQLPTGTRVLLDDALIGTVGTEGTLSRSGISPGRHTLQFAVKGYDTITLTQDFAAAQTLALTLADVKLTKSPATLDLRADPGTAITLAQAGRTIQQVNGPGKITVPDGSYDLIVKGPAGVETSSRVAASPGASLTIDARNLIVSGMERFDLTSWTQQDSWYTRRGGNFVLYSRPVRDGTISFTIRLDRNGNPFSTGSRLNWVVGYVDSRNYVQLQIDKEFFYRAVITRSTPVPAPRQAHNIPTNVPYVNIRIRAAGTQLIHEFSVRENVWQVLDAWNAASPDPKRSLLDGAFGFFLPGAEELTISNFRYYPPVTPTQTSPGR